MKKINENAEIMRIELRIDVLRDRLEHASECGLPDEPGVRQKLATAERELAKLHSPFEGEAA